LNHAEAVSSILLSAFAVFIMLGSSSVLAFSLVSFCSAQRTSTMK
jgi:hypothetical protein